MLYPGDKRIAHSPLVIRLDPSRPKFSFFVQFYSADEATDDPRRAAFRYDLPSRRWYGSENAVADMCASVRSLYEGSMHPVPFAPEFTVEAWDEFQTRFPGVDPDYREAFAGATTVVGRTEAECLAEVEAWGEYDRAERERIDRIWAERAAAKAAEKAAAASERQRKIDEENAGTMAHLVGAAVEEIDAAYEAMKLLAAADMDHATYLNGRGFGHAHTKIGHRLSKLAVRRRQPLDDAFALKLARLHRGQLPEEMAARIGSARA
ncbi:hypothetical protein [Aureimonas sp. N4]|uniref:hypothetical protein n=1 Tax=Aureimonas sp. N4 TaxID=1638165 RepID=UPI000783CCC3|nr:hypothetical protein [Aureimonas sp. N4]